MLKKKKKESSSINPLIMAAAKIRDEHLFGHSTALQFALARTPKDHNK